MAEETVPVRPASPITKPRGDDKRISSAHDRRGSTGSCHELSKQGKSDERVSEEKESRPWRKPVKENGVTAGIKKTIDVKPKPTIEKGKQKIVTTSDSEYVDVHTEQSASDIMMSVTGDSIISEGTESILPNEDTVKQEYLVASEIDKVTTEEISLNAKDLDLFKKSCSLSKVKPSLLKLPSLISSHSSAGRSLDGKKSVGGNKVLEGRRSFDGRKAVGLGKSLDGRKPSDESKSVDTVITREADGNGSNVENNNKGCSTGTDEMKSAEGSKSVPAKKGLRKSKSFNLETTKKDAGLVNAKSKEKSDLLKKLDATPKPKIFSMSPSRSLNSAALKPLPLLYPSNDSSSKTSDNNQASKKISTSKLDAKRVNKPISVSQSSFSPSANGEERTDVTKVRVMRVISTVRRPSKVTKVAANGLIKQGIHEDTADIIELTPEKKLLASTKIKATSSNLLRSPAPSLTKSTVKSRTSYLPSHVKKSVGESQQNAAANDKPVNLESDKKKPSKLKEKSTAFVVETIPRRSSLIKDNPTGGVHKNISDKFLQRRPVVRRKKILVLSNKVIEETANRLIRTRKSKVLALIGAFETVISIQKNPQSEPKR